MTDPNALAAKALTQMERTFADPDRLKNSESAMNAFCDAMEGLRVLAPRIAELEAEVEMLREALEVCVAELYAPDSACSCHIHRPAEIVSTMGLYVKRLPSPTPH